MTLPRGQHRPHREPEKSWSSEELEEIERAHANGMSVQQIVDAFTARGSRLTEATFRKYVQLGLLPRSVRVGRKGKHRGSQGLYPATAVRQIDHIRRLMHQGFTMEEIQKEFLFVRGDIDALSRQLDRVYQAIENAIDDQQRAATEDPGVHDALHEVRELGKELVEKLEVIERRLTMRARMARAAV
ncbi:MAG: MerR family transcriptional regulator [Myxococcales bacterium]|nr:MerR family transcriptional regulator [Myxococcales bacterium]MDH3843442.1 MerR family transcriptional regulator [Myxococcales bacterium]